jgi:hypothetical protein
MSKKKRLFAQNEATEGPGPHEEGNSVQQQEKGASEHKGIKSIASQVTGKVVAVAFVGLVLGLIVGQVVLPAVGVGLVSMPAASQPEQEGPGTIVLEGDITEAELNVKISDYLKELIADSTISVDVTSIENANQGLFVATVALEKDGDVQEMPVYVTKDGSSLVIGQKGQNIFFMDEPLGPEKSDRPLVEVFVMSFCPYGMEGEKLVKPVYDLLKDEVDFKLRFFATPLGSTIEEVRSLHGNLEAQEDARQVCIDKLFPDKLWDYVYEMAESCPTAYNDAATLDACWKAAAEKTGVDTAQVQACYDSEADMILGRFEEDGGLIAEYGLSGSESIVINGEKVPAGAYRWDPEKLKDLVCDAFTEAPQACGQTLAAGDSSAPASGSC